jgi:hypothetical protein
MGEIKDEINWENFLDNYFDLYRPLTKKKEYKNGLTIYYKSNSIYVRCDLSIDRLTIKKLEFGRLIIDEKGEEQSNWIKGVFINDKHFYMTFLQTSFDSEYFDKRNNYTIQFDNLNKNVISRFLNAPCLTGWTEKEYQLDNDTYYKVIVTLDNFNWTIKLQNIGEQDIPFLTDFFDIWLRVKIADAFWNSKRRTVKEIIVKPMKA